MTGAAPEPGFSRAEWLAKILRERILQSTYPPGHRVREAELQAEFGFSNGPIREALQLLVADGLMERSPWRGVRVVQLDDREIAELFEVRLALLETGSALAARRGPEEIIQEADTLRTQLRVLEAEVRSGAIPSFSGQLSAWIFRAAGNDRLRAVWDKTVLQSLVYVNAALRQSAGERSIPLIYALIDAIVERNVSEARDVARRLTCQTLADLGIEADI